MSFFPFFLFYFSFVLFLEVVLEIVIRRFARNFFFSILRFFRFVFEIRLGDRGSMPEEIVIKDIVKMVSLMIINKVFAGL